MAKLIVNGGNLVWDGKKGRGGHVMFILQWLEGLRRLGHEVLYYDSIDESVEAAKLFAQIIDRWWQPELSAAVLSSGKAQYGLNAHEVEKFGRNAAAIITLGCTYRPEPEPWLADVYPRILIDQDPGFSQVWASEKGPDNIFGRHDIYFTVGANVGTSRCTLPDFGITWEPIWNPVVIDWWNSNRPVGLDCFTTVSGWWMGEYQVYNGHTWGPKAEEIKKFIDLPRLVGETVEIALDTGSSDETIPYLQKHGWTIKSPDAVAFSPDAFRDYVSDSVGEFSCAKGLYVGTRCGWFSDRSSCYLAAGRPVVVQDTGFADVLPTGDGIFSVSTTEDAAEAIQAIRADYEHHSKTARSLAIEHFDSRKVLLKILNHVGVD
jgi:hypothetical protein